MTSDNPGEHVSGSVTKSAGRLTLLVLHAVLVIPPAVIFLSADEGPDADIGRGIIGLFLLLLGLPWSLLVVLLNVYSPPLPDSISALTVVPALVNLALHVWLGFVRARAGHAGQRLETGDAG
ncbi:hypothetical protein [Actinoplanes sp. HUAS TT8]|uniref:hypothetical protein n=1 Tax=Actinoplanes sp. HUAS TT8 TaxID=3447453 RepID=UPI003F51CA62